MKIRKLIEEDGRKLAKIFDEQILATINTDTLDEQIEAILDWFWDCVVDHYEGKPQGGNFSTKAIVKLKTLFTEHSKQAYKKGYMDGAIAEIKAERTAQLSKRNKGEDNG